MSGYLTLIVKIDLTIVFFAEFSSIWYIELGDWTSRSWSKRSPNNAIKVDGGKITSKGSFMWYDVCFKFNCNRSNVNLTGELIPRCDVKILWILDYLLMIKIPSFVIFVVVVELVNCIWLIDIVFKQVDFWEKSKLQRRLCPIFLKNNINIYIVIYIYIYIYIYSYSHLTFINFMIN